MKYHTLRGVAGNKAIEKKCARLVLGTAHFYRYSSRQEAFAILDEYIQLGGNILDMAHQYIESEEIVGEWLGKRNNRDQLFILTKGAHPDDGEPGPRLNARAIAKDIRESLERLHTDFLDFFALHRDDPAVEVGPVMEALNEHIAAGRVHAIGASNWSVERIREANEYSARKGLIGFTFNSPHFSLAECNEPRWPGCVTADEGMRKWHIGTQLPLLSWSAQAGGFFSGRFTPENKENEEITRVYFCDGNWERLRRAQILAVEKGVTAIQIALAFVLNQAFPSAAIIGPEKAEELHSSVEGAQMELTTAELDWLDLKREVLP